MTVPTGDETGRPGGDDRDEPPARPGTRTFTIEGRRAPGLFVVGWIATLVGLGVVVVGIVSNGAIPAPLFLLGALVLSVGLIAGAGSQAIERRARHAPFGGPSPFLLFAAVIPTYVVLLVAALFVLSLVGIEPSASPAAAIFEQLILLAVYAGLIRLTVVGTDAASWSDLGLRRPEERSAVAFGVIFAVPLVFISGLVAALLVQVLPTPPSPLPEAHDTAGLLLNLVAASIIAPVGEELFFRGYATTAWLRSIGPWPAIIRAGLFFAFAHVITVSGSDFGDAAGQALVAFAVRVPVALALGWLFVRTRSIYPTIALHATFNGLPLLLVLAGAG
ncbi:MAG TPA: type II CAAX endopeptidase family protein [Candidatus Limnocylindrales bacterium]|nr:type II CAAX endopeptidase family protein [Candidatus Limnocylindrales bacterium]